LFQNRLDAIDVEKAVQFVLKCMNFDGGFGSKPGSESHAGLIYCCVGLLSITGIYKNITEYNYYKSWTLVIKVFFRTFASDRC